MKKREHKTRASLNRSIAALRRANDRAEANLKRERAQRQPLGAIWRDSFSLIRN